MLLLFTFAVVAIAISFLCSLLEAALLSLTPSYIARQKEQRPGLHKALSSLKDNIDRPLAAILTLNTVAHTAGATGVGAQVSILYGEVYIGVASGVMTLLILVLSEIIPKTIGARYWRTLAPVLPPILRIMILVLLPFVWLSEIITARLGKSEHDVDLRTEISTLARIGLEEKAIDPDEARVITNILNLHHVEARSIMTPRTVCVTVPPKMTVREFDTALAKSAFTRFPVMDREEMLLGYVHKGEIHKAEDHQTMEALMHPIEGALDKHSAELVFRAMLRERSHMRAVYDEHGTWLGLLTMEDILETILGLDIVDETDDIQNMRRFARERWLKRLERHEQR